MKSHCFEPYKPHAKFIDHTSDNGGIWHVAIVLYVRKKEIIIIEGTEPSPIEPSGLRLNLRIEPNGSSALNQFESRCAKFRFNGKKMHMYHLKQALNLDGKNYKVLEVFITKHPGKKRIIEKEAPEGIKDAGHIVVIQPPTGDDD